MNIALDVAQTGIAIDPGGWAQHHVNNRPMMAFWVPAVFAVSHDEAYALTHFEVDRLLDLLALHRRASGTPWLTVVWNPATARTWTYRDSGNYIGNLIGGFLSGEDVETLIKHRIAIDNDPVAALWLSLYRDAQAERNVDFAFAKWWTVLESIAEMRRLRESVAANQRVVDFAGQTLTDGGQIATVGRERGGVYQLLKSYSQGAEGTFAPAPLGYNLWELVGIWYGYRHGAMHYGGAQGTLARVSGGQKPPAWLPSVEAAEKVAHALVGQAQAQTLDHPFLKALREAVFMVLHWELDAAAGFASAPPLV